MTSDLRYDKSSLDDSPVEGSSHSSQPPLKKNKLQKMATTSKPPGAKNRPRSSMACLKCRERKVKCNISTLPAGNSCSNCVKGDIHCVVNHEDNRKLQSSKKYILGLKERIEYLEAVIMSSFRPTTIVPEESTSGNQAQQVPEQAPEKVVKQSPQQAPEQGKNTAVGPSDYTWNNLGQRTPRSLSALESDPDTLNNVVKPPNESTSIRKRAQNSIEPGSFDLEGHHTLDEHGQVRYFGPTSGRYLAPFQGNAEKPDPQNPITAHDLAFIETEDFITSHLNIYWKFQTLSIPVVDKEAFLQDMKLSRRTQYYSPFLLDCILAASVRLSARVAFRKICTLFEERAKMKLVEEMDSPTIATIQGLCVLSDYQSSSGREHVGYVYTGIASRIIFDLGLHRDCSDLKDIGYLSPKDTFIRQQVFAACFAYDTLWSIFVGRPSSIRATDFYIPQLLQTSKSTEIRLLATWVDQCVLMTEVSVFLNSSRSADDISNEKIVDLKTRLSLWRDTVPAELQFDEKHPYDLLQCAYALHMQFYRVVLLLHRTLMAIEERRIARCSTAQGDGEPSPTYLEYKQICHDSSMMTLKLLGIYRIRFGTELFPQLLILCSFSAATTLVSYICTQKEQDTLPEREMVLTYLDTLRTLPVQYAIASHILEGISSMIKRCNLMELLGSSSPNQQSQVLSGSNTLSQLRNEEPTSDANGQGKIVPHSGVLSAHASPFPIEFDSWSSWMEKDDMQF